VPWVTSGALNAPFVREPSGYVTERALTETNLRLFPAHTLLVALYGEGKTRGKCSELLIEATTNQAVAAIEMRGLASSLREFLKWYFVYNYEAFRQRAAGGVQPNLNLGIVENTPIPLCSIEEAQEIANILGAAISVADELDAEISLQIEKTKRLRQSILKMALSGALVTLDPSDESAAVLLDRIKAEKGANNKKTNRKDAA
jgi:type I restriction enzyme, S subunit